MDQETKKLVEEAKENVKIGSVRMLKLMNRELLIDLLAEYIEDTKKLGLNTDQVEALKTVIMIIGHKDI